jgi:predicted Zn-dependent protease
VEGRTEQESDTNRGGVWGTYLHTDKGLPVEGARRIRAALYQFGKLPLDKNSMALVLLEEEVRAFLTSARARSAWWMARYKESGEAVQQRDEILGEIRRLCESHADQSWAYVAAALGYNGLNRNAQAVDVMRAFVKRFPEEASLDDSLLFYFGNWGTAADLEALLGGSRRWAEKASYWETLVRAYDRTNAGPE